MIVLEITQPQNAQYLDTILNTVKKNIINRPVSPKRISKLLDSIFKKEYGVTVGTMSADKNIDVDEINLNGYFDPERWDEWENIELVLIHHPNNKKNIIFDNISWKNLKFHIKQVLLHEFIHREQYKKRNGFNPNKILNITDLLVKFRRTPDEEQKEYLSNIDEIEAHAHDIVLELHNENLNFNEIKNILRTFSKIPNKAQESKSITLWAYGKYFNRNTNHPVIKLLLKKIYAYLQYYRDK